MIILLHGHHAGALLSYFDTAADAKARIVEVPLIKPEHELPTRMRLMRLLTKKEEATLPKALREAAAKWQEAYAKLVEAAAKWQEAAAKWREAYTKRWEAEVKWREADTKWREAQFTPEMKRWHAKHCVKDCPWDWDRRTIFP